MRISAVQLLLVGAGGAAGAVLRVVISSLVPAGRMPWGTLFVNVLGSALMGVLMARLNTPSSANAHWHALLTAGFCGGFTTFSAFSWQMWEQARAGRPELAIGHALLAVVTCLLATWLGWRLGRA